MSYFSQKLLNNYIFCLLIFHSIYFFLNSIPSMSFLNLHHLYAYINFAYCIPWLLIFHSIYASFMSFFLFLLLTSSFSSLFFSPHIITHPTSLLLLPFIFHLILHIIFLVNHLQLSLQFIPFSGHSQKRLILSRFLLFCFSFDGFFFFFSLMIHLVIVVTSHLG
jgi:hypothetical protein